MPNLADMNRQWWKEAVVYQIYPRSFQDSTGDGMGDLRGIINRVDYLASLGIDVVWLNPIFGSPNADNGYDISDYRDIMPEFGTMADFDELLEALHARGIRVVLDLVVNHSSDEHPWFQASRSSRDNPYRDYYHWWPAEKGTPPSRWSFFAEDGSAWRYDAQTDAYYLHYFAAKQPDLNWENPELRQEVYDMMHFWLKKGIDGFRLDAVTFISKHDGYPAFPEGTTPQQMVNKYYSQGPRLHEFFKEMNREVLSHYDVMTVAEGPGTTPENVLQLVGEDAKELNMSYHFEHQGIGVGFRHMIEDGYGDLVEFKRIMSKWDAAFETDGWNTVYFTNHDHARMVSRWGDDSPAWRELSSKMLTLYLLSMRGTPYWYMGDEIGMTNIKFERIEDYQDLMTINWYNLYEQEGGDTQAFLESQKITGRDNARTPIQWDDSDGAGFTTGKPWLAINENRKQINVAAQDNDPGSVLNFFRRMVQLRKDDLTLVYGGYTLLFEDHPATYAYVRDLDDRRLLVLCNFSSESTTLALADELHPCAEPLINNYPQFACMDGAVVLEPWQGVIVPLT